MQKSEKFIITFGGNHCTTNVKTASEKWKKYAQKVYEKTGIYINAIIQQYNVVCGMFDECENNEIECVQIVCVRNPVLVPDQQLYQYAIQMVFEFMKKDLKEPFASIEYSKMEFSYFVPRV